jgi:hypothetical protein
MKTKHILKYNEEDDMWYLFMTTSDIETINYYAKQKNFKIEDHPLENWEEHFNNLINRIKNVTQPKPKSKQ